MTAKSEAGRIGLFPASFDPVTNGHLDLIHRSLQLFDEVVVAVARNVEKSGTFSWEERLELLNGVVGSVDRVRVESFEGLVVDFGRSLGVSAIIASGATGSLREEIEPGHVVLCDQVIDRTYKRENTFFDDDLVAHIEFSEPFCPRLRAVL